LLLILLPQRLHSIALTGLTLTCRGFVAV